MIIISLFDEVEIDDRGSGGYLDDETSIRREKRFLGSVVLPFQVLADPCYHRGTTPLFVQNDLRDGVPQPQRSPNIGGSPCVFYSSFCCLLCLGDGYFHRVERSIFSKSLSWQGYRPQSSEKPFRQTRSVPYVIYNKF